MWYCSLTTALFSCANRVKELWLPTGFSNERHLLNLTRKFYQTAVLQLNRRMTRAVLLFVSFFFIARFARYCFDFVHLTASNYEESAANLTLWLRCFCFCFVILSAFCFCQVILSPVTALFLFLLCYIVSFLFLSSYIITCDCAVFVSVIPNVCRRTELNWTELASSVQFSSVRRRAFGFTLNCQLFVSVKL
jgi:hypothetical protein